MNLQRSRRSGVGWFEPGPPNSRIRGYSKTGSPPLQCVKLGHQFSVSLFRAGWNWGLWGLFLFSLCEWEQKSQVPLVNLIAPLGTSLMVEVASGSCTGLLDIGYGSWICFTFCVAGCMNISEGRISTVKQRIGHSILIHDLGAASEVLNQGRVSARFLGDAAGQLKKICRKKRSILYKLKVPWKFCSPLSRTYLVLYFKFNGNSLIFSTVEMWRRKQGFSPGLPKPQAVVPVLFKSQSVGI